MIKIRSGRTISNIIISTLFGISGNIFWPLKLSPNIRNLIEVVERTETTKFGKSFTFSKRKGNVRHRNPITWFKYIKPIGKNSMLNAFGLTNDGLSAEAMKVARAWDNRFVPNFAPNFSMPGKIVLAECQAAINFLYALLGDRFDTLILNGSCPNTGEEVDKNVQKIIYACGELCKKYPHPHFELIVKISYLHPYEMSEELERLGIRIIESINTIPHKVLYPHKKSPIKIGGGYSGEEIKPYSLKYNRGLRKKVGLKLIMGGGVTVCDDVRAFQDIGADAVSACTVFRRNPKEGIKILEKYNGGER